MNDEIKEILEALKPHNDIKEYPLTLSVEEQKLLLDYITNLQEENEKLLKKSYSDDVKITKAIEYMNNYIELEDAPINERIKIEFKEVIKLLNGGDKE